MLRYLNAGESHGPALVAVVEAAPAGVPPDLGGDRPRAVPPASSATGAASACASRRTGWRCSGGCATAAPSGKPLAVRIANSEWPKWTEVLSPDPVADPEAWPDRQGRPADPAAARPADLTGMQKYGFSEARPVLERASARETAARVAAGAAAKALLGQVGVAVVSHVVRLGPAATRSRALPTPADLEEIDASPVRCLDGEAEGPDGGRGRRGQGGRRHPRRGVRGSRPRPAPRPRVLCPVDRKLDARLAGLS